MGTEVGDCPTPLTYMTCYQYHSVYVSLLRFHSKFFLPTPLRSLLRHLLYTLNVSKEGVVRDLPRRVQGNPPFYLLRARRKQESNYHAFYGKQ
jgi:hypothetical protein